MTNGSSNQANDKNSDFNVDVHSVPMAPIFIKIDKPLDVISVLHAYALKLKLGLIILSALGTVRKVFLPLTTKKTYDDGVFQIISLSGKITPLRSGGIVGDINLVMSDVHGGTIGGIVQHLYAETTVEVTICPCYYDPSRSHPFDFDPPLIFGNPFLPEPSLPNANNPSSSVPNSNNPSSSDPDSNNPSFSDPSSGHLTFSNPSSIDSGYRNDSSSTHPSSSTTSYGFSSPSNKSEAGTNILEYVTYESK